jgi:CMP-N-acetylneuraminic acid synthetase
MDNAVPKVTALLPMRHNSQRVPGKNYRPFGDGRSLFEHVLIALLGCQNITAVVINTDSDVVKKICSDKYPGVIIHDRPEHLRDGNIPMNEIILNDLKKLDGDYFLQTHSTNPMVTSSRFDEAISTFFQNIRQHDSLFSVTRLQTRLWDELARPINHNKDILLRTQDLPPIFEENSCFYLFHRKMIEHSGLRIGNRPYLFELDKLETADIDVESDFVMAEQLFKLKNS